jgi:hypothetical protein
VKEEHRLRVSKKQVLKKILGPKREKVRENGENCLMKIFTTLTPHNKLLG